MEEHFLPVFGFDVDGIVGGVESFLIDFPDIAQGDIEVIKHLIFKCLYTHMIKGCVSMCRTKYYKSLFAYSYLSLNHSQNIDEQALCFKLFYLRSLSAVRRKVINTQ